ncbi:MAG: peptidylprolyl isomerase [Lachnospiraceae bacterium]|nr:peptidylprolyl isomerase [Lachnospiraceae bacterium]
MSEAILATINGVNITDADIDAFISTLPGQQQAYAQNPQFRKQCLDQVVAIHLFAKYGEEIKLEETEEFQEVLEKAKRDIYAQLAMKKVLSDVEVTEEEARTFYAENPQHFRKSETVSAKHILVADEDACKAVLASIENGEKTFEDAAKECSTCPSGSKGGDLGSFGKGQMVKEFEDAAFSAEIGKVVGPVKTQFGYHLIKVEAKTEASVASFEEVAEQIGVNLAQRKQSALYTAKVNELRAKYMGE